MGSLQADAVERYREVLSSAALLRERYQTGRVEPFNLFTVLRKPSDEEHLHSRFLHALLDHRDAETGQRDNAADFLADVLDLPDFGTDDVRVDRESNGIDLLVANHREAVVIENKIYAADQPEQLQRYFRTLVEDESYDASAVHLCYLTLDGAQPEPHSIGTLGHRLKRVSYRDQLVPWLRRCQRRAFDEPPLRESIAQYLRLVRRLTGTNYEGAHMNELKDLCKSNDNMVLVRDLLSAFTEAKADLFVRLFEVVGQAIAERVPNIHLDPDYVTQSTAKEIRRSVTSQRRGRCALYYLIEDGAWFSVVANDWLTWGIVCERDSHQETYERLRERLADVAPALAPNEWWPWWRQPDPGIHLKHASAEALMLLASKDRVNELAGVIARDVGVLSTVLAGGSSDAAPH